MGYSFSEIAAIPPTSHLCGCAKEIHLGYAVYTRRLWNSAHVSIFHFCPDLILATHPSSAVLLGELAKIPAYLRSLTLGQRLLATQRPTPTSRRASMRKTDHTAGLMARPCPLRPARYGRGMTKEAFEAAAGSSDRSHSRERSSMKSARPSTCTPLSLGPSVGQMSLSFRERISR